jgi:uncharacterized protein (TIGR03067 family)
MKRFAPSLCSITNYLTLLAVLLGLPRLAFAAGQPDLAKSLQGVWRGVRYSDGKGENASDGVKLQISFNGSRAACKSLPDNQPSGEGTFTVSADGKQIDAVGSADGKTYHGILKLEGDRLLWCTATSGKQEDRPKDFVADSAKESYLIIVKRQKR